jgi:hypothetical protein
MRHALSGLFGQSPSATFARPSASERPGSLRCSICAARLRSEIAYLDETGNVPEPRRSWVLCSTCDASVRAELARSPVEGPLRVRIAVGLVAAERAPNALRSPRTALDDGAWLSVLFWGFGLVMILHLLVIAWIAYLIR